MTVICRHTPSWILNTSNSNVDIEFFSYNEGAVPKPNTDVMLAILNKYISATADSIPKKPGDASYGIAAMACLRDFFIDEVKDKGKTYIDRRNKNRERQAYHPSAGKHAPHPHRAEG